MLPQHLLTALTGGAGVFLVTLCGLGARVHYGSLPEQF